MIPIDQLLNRIRWDPEFARGNFQLGYFDRTEDRIILVPFEQVSFPAESPQTFQLTDAEGQSHRIPFHRVREVYKDAQRIWHRPETLDKEEAGCSHARSGGGGLQLHHSEAALPTPPHGEELRHGSEGTAPGRSSTSPSPGCR